ncbi:cuticle protein 16.8-like [Stegodyphus dumicola]|uniref:cuticle protein 16.8-like n=1 Tax=Stegodyphus dumicola TaxID=202533 RepID=UPI0015A8457C|nr:cuticle protein 16.8-like [Stegodyphus dumicola]
MSIIALAILLLAASSFCYAEPIFPAAIPDKNDQALPKPYEFGYEFGDGLGMTQHRYEVSDGNGIVKGKYGYLDPLGVYRNVEYTADAEGYKAVVHSNEPGTANQNTADVAYVVQFPPPVVIAQGLRAEFPRLSL